jgi:uncharacterized protein with HEPN domain
VGDFDPATGGGFSSGHRGNILDSINDTDEFVKGMAFEDFIKDKKSVNAVIRSIEVIGEAAKISLSLLEINILTFPGRKWLE